MSKEKSFIKTKVVDYAVVEVIDFEMKLNQSDQEKFEENPEEVVKRLLEESGQVVNRVMLTANFINRYSKKTTKTRKKGSGRQRPGHYHIQAPRSERSGWICA